MFQKKPNVNDNENVNGNENVNVNAQESCNNLQEVFEFYNNNIGTITSYGAEVLEDYTQELGKELVIYAMKLSVESNARTIKYIKAILNNWSMAGIKTLVEAEEMQRTRNLDKKAKCNNFEQRSYDNFDNLYANKQE